MFDLRLADGLSVTGPIPPIVRYLPAFRWATPVLEQQFGIPAKLLLPESGRCRLEDAGEREQVKPSLAIWRTSRSHHRTANLSASGRKTMPQVSSLAGRCSGGKLIPARLQRLQYCLTFAAKRVMAARSPTIIFKLLARLRPGRERRRGAVVKASSGRLGADHVR